MDKDTQREIRKIIDEIERKSADGDYIYRGEPEKHEEEPHCGKVSSNLWREYGIQVEGFDIEVVQKEMLNGAKKHTGYQPEDFRAEFAAYPYVIRIDDDEAADFEILTEIQHYGGKTNLIDFTTDYFIALFFACDGYHEEDGRVILQKTEEIRNMIAYPRNPRHRVIAQKSVFVRPPKGFIEPRKGDIVSIPGHLKQWILQHLRKYHGISTEPIYNDLYGYIRSQGIHGDAYTWFYRGYASQNRWAEATSSEERQKENEKSIKSYTQAIKFKPNFMEAFHNLADVYLRMQRYDHAIDKFNKAIELDPNHIISYNGRAFCRGMDGDYDRALEDCKRALELDSNNSDAYNTRGVIYHKRGDYRCAVDEFSKAIKINRNYDHAYYNRGEARLHLKEWDAARRDLTYARDLGLDIIVEFRKEYETAERFHNKTGLSLPAAIAEILTTTES